MYLKLQFCFFTQGQGEHANGQYTGTWNGRESKDQTFYLGLWLKYPVLLLLASVLPFVAPSVSDIQYPSESRPRVEEWDGGVVRLVRVRER